MSVTARLLSRQERVIQELISFMRECFEKIFITLEQLEPEIADELATQLPTQHQYSRLDKDNPFALYCGYIDLGRPIAYPEKAVWAEARCEQLEE